MPKLTKVEALQRTKRMLVREWRLPQEPLSTDNLRNPPPAGLGKNDNQLRALERPIELVDFSDVATNVTGSSLLPAKTVAQLRDKIWDGIPKTNKA